MVLKEEFGDIHRLANISGILVKYGLGPWIDDAVSDHSILNVFKRFGWYKKIKDLDMTKAVRIRMAIEELGPVFIKFGQMLSTRADLFDKAYIDELSKLQDQVPPFPWKEAVLIMNEGLGKDFNKVFSSIKKEPMAAASLGQVYDAVLASGEHVIVKVQRPDVLDQLEQDLRLMKYLLKIMLKNNPDWESLNPQKIVEEFDKSLHIEVDYLLEARYASNFKKNFEGDKHISAPTVYWDYTSEKVLVLEYISGDNLNVLIKKRNKKRNKLISERLMDAYLKQLFSHQFFHADPHPSNILVMPSNKIYFIDFGMMKYIGSVFSGVLGDMLLKIMLGDINGLVNLLVSSKMAPGGTDVEKLRTDLEKLYVKSYESKKDSSIGACLEKMMYLFREYKINLPGDYALLIKSFIEIEGTIRQLYPEFDVAGYTKKYLADASTLKAVGMRKVDEVRKTIEGVIESLGALPSAISDFTKTISDGTIKVDVKVETLDALRQELDRISNRIIAGLVLVAILIGSSLISVTDKGPLWFGFPIFGIVGFVLATILGFWMIVSIIRKGGI